MKDNFDAGPRGLRVVSNRDDLAVIHDKDCGAALWQRQLAPSFQAWLESLSPEQLPKTRVILRPERIADALEQVCDIASMPNCEQRAGLVADAARLAAQFVAITSAPYLRLRLDVVTTNACRKFHIDAVTARLLCTYLGTGTQIGVSHDGAEPAQIYTVPTGSPLILRGTLWSEDVNAGLVHRSPPIEGTGEHRLVLVLDPIFDLADNT